MKAPLLSSDFAFSGHQRRQIAPGRPPFLSSCLPNILVITVGALLVLTHIPCADAALRNVTIDDEFGDELTDARPTFLPPSGGVWDDEDCTGCFIRPDPALAYRATYNAVTYRRDQGVDFAEFSFRFTGECSYSVLFTV